MTGIVHSTTDPVSRLDLGEAFLQYVLAPDTYIGTHVMASAPVTRKSGVWPSVLRAQFLRGAASVVRAPGAAYSRGHIKTGELTYACVERGHEVPLPDSERSLWSHEFDAEIAIMAEAFNKIVMAQEIAIAAAVFDGTTNFTVANGLRTDVAAAWSTASTDILGDVATAREAVRQRTGMDPDTMTVGAGVIPFFLKNTAIRAALPNSVLQSVEGIVAALPALFGLDKILVGKGVQNTAGDALTPVYADIWGSGWCSIGRTAAPGSSLATPCFGRTLFWIDDADTDSALAESYREPQTRSTIYRARSNADELMVDTSQMQLLDIAA